MIGIVCEKLELVLQTYDLIRLLGPSCRKLVFGPKIQNVTALGPKNFLMSSFIKFCLKQAFIFKF